MATNRTGYTGDLNAYNFPLRGRFICIAPLNTVIPATVLPFDETSIPTGWEYLGPTENGVVGMTLNIQTASIFSGVVPTERKKYIESQSGSIETNLLRYEPGIMAKVLGGDLDAITAAAGGSRAFRDLWLGGKLGDKQALLVVEDYDDTLKEDVVVAPASVEAEYEQTWYYNPNTQKQGDVGLSQEITKTPVVPMNFALFGFNHGGVSRLIQVRFIATA